MEAVLTAEGHPRDAARARRPTAEHRPRGATDEPMGPVHRTLFGRELPEPAALSFAFESPFRLRTTRSARGALHGASVTPPDTR